MKKSLFAKKAIVTLFSFFLIFGFISCSSDSSDTADNGAFSVGSSKYATLQDAVDSISSDSAKAATTEYTIKLLRDVSDAGATIPFIEGSLIIDFGSYTYTLENSETGITIADGATGITIANGNIVPGNNNKFDSIISSSGELEIDGLKIDAQNTEFDAIKADNGSIKIKGASEVKVAENKNVLNLSGKANASVVSENVSLAGGLTMAGTSSMDLTKGEFKIGKTSLEEGISITGSEESKIEALDETDETAINNINQYKKYLITFYVNNISTDLKRVTSGSTITKPDDPSIIGYTFNGWYADENYETEFDFDTTINENKTIYAKLVPVKVKITFDYIFNEVKPVSPQNVNYGDSIISKTVNYGDSIKKPFDPIYVERYNFDTEYLNQNLIEQSFKSYIFGGWYLDEDFTAEWDFNTKISSTEDITLYAKWYPVDYIYKVYTSVFDSEKSTLTTYISGKYIDEDEKVNSFIDIFEFTFNIVDGIIDSGTCKCTINNVEYEYTYTVNDGHAVFNSDNEFYVYYYGYISDLISHIIENMSDETWSIGICKGTLFIDFRNDKTCTLGQDGEYHNGIEYKNFSELETGTYEVDDSTITITYDEESNMYDDEESNMYYDDVMYEYKISGNVLTLKEIVDPEYEDEGSTFILKASGSNDGIVGKWESEYYFPVADVSYPNDSTD